MADEAAQRNSLQQRSCALYYCVARRRFAVDGWCTTAVIVGNPRRSAVGRPHNDSVLTMDERSVVATASCGRTKRATRRDAKRSAMDVSTTRKCPRREVVSVRDKRLIMVGDKPVTVRRFERTTEFTSGRNERTMVRVATRFGFYFISNNGVGWVVGLGCGGA